MKLGKHSGSFQHCHPSVQSSSKAETFQSPVQETSLKQFWGEYTPDICTSKNYYSYWALGTVCSFPGMHYENNLGVTSICKYEILHLNNIKTFRIQGETNPEIVSQRKTVMFEICYNLEERKVLSQLSVVLSDFPLKEFIYYWWHTELPCSCMRCNNFCTIIAWSQTLCESRWKVLEDRWRIFDTNTQAKLQCMLTYDLYNIICTYICFFNVILTLLFEQTARMKALEP